MSTLKERYEKMFGKLIPENHLGQRQVVKESGYFNTETDSFGVMVNLRYAKEVQSYFQDTRPHGIKMAGSSNLYYASNEDTLYDFLSGMGQYISTPLDNIIETVFYNGKELSFDEFHQEVGPIE